MPQPARRPSRPHREPVNSRPYPSLVRARVWIAWLLLALLSTRANLARALDRQTEAAAQRALSAAASDHAAHDDDGGLLRLRRALKGCGSSRCSPTTRAALLRDIGAFQFVRGDKAQASSTFNEALDAAPDIGWNTAWGEDVASEWTAVHNERAALGETPPEGDLQHVPEHEQAVDTPLPIYAESSLSGIATVVVKYKVPGESGFKRRTLPRFGGGWGGTIPCQDVKRGLLRYFLQAFDASGTPVGNSGDLKHLYFVPIRWALTGDPPHLPGHAPPETCKGQTQAEEEVPLVEGKESTAAPSSRYVHLWLGVSGSFDVSFISGATNACALTAALLPVNAGYYCTNPDGSDFPSRNGRAAAGDSAAPLVAGKAGSLNSGVTTGDVRILVTLDYAVNTHFMTGVRAGYVAQAYPGAAASNDGHAISAPIHLELRETYLFGSDPLAHAGFAPYIFVAAGYAKFDAGELSSANVQGVQGPLPVTVWQMAGPFFAAAGTGARYAFSPRVALLAGLKATLPFGFAGILPSIAPEASLQYGF
jgi:hypothetical protein